MPHNTNNIAIDNDLILSDGQVLDSTANTAATTELNFGGDVGRGKRVNLVINVTALVGTLDITACTKATATVAVTDRPYTLAQIASGATGQYHFTLDQEALQYFNIFYSAGTSATVTSWVTALPQ
jgi:hypothetical protein